MASSRNKYRDIIASSILFDENHFRREAKISQETDAIFYYIDNWQAINAETSPFFSNEFYKAAYPDVKDSKYPPLVHYILYGWKEGRSPSHDFDRQAFLSQHPGVDSQKFDAAVICIMIYGGYTWTRDQAPSHVPAPAPQRSVEKAPIERQVDHLKSFISYEPSKVRTADIGVTDFKRMRITWVIPDFLPGAGGHMTIFRVASHLEKFGHDVKFLIQNPTVHASGAAALETINNHFQPFSGKVEVFQGSTPHATGDALIATDRFTCYPVKAMGGFHRKFYFVQDYESSFYPAGTEALLTNATYEFDFDCLCAGDWLHQIMTEKYGRWSTSWPLAYDASVYNQESDATVRSANRIALYARYVTPRRAVELAFMALEILEKRGLNFEVDFFGWQLGQLSVNFPYRDHGILSGEQLANLYRTAAVGVVFSATNHSLVNKEMMACGLPVIDLDLDTVRAIFPEKAMAFAHPSPEGIADQIEALLTNEKRRADLRKEGLSFVNGLSWEKSARMVEQAIMERVRLGLQQVR